MILRLQYKDGFVGIFNNVVSFEVVDGWAIFDTKETEDEDNPILIPFDQVKQVFIAED